jgi:hypothetical protein
MLPRTRGARSDVRFRRVGQRREQHEHEHHHDILDDEPADRDAAIGLIERSALL